MAKQFFADFKRIVPDHFLFESVANIYMCLLANRNYVACLSSSSVLGAGSSYVVSSTIIQMFARVFMHITWVCRLVVLWYKNCNIFWTDAIPAWSVHHPFSPQGSPTFVGHIFPYTVVLETLILLSWKFFYISVLLNYYAYTYSFFDNIPPPPFCRKTAIYSLVCLLTFLLLTTCSLMHRSVVLNNFAISLTKWPEYRKNRCLSCSKNSVCLHFRERVEETKENGKNTKIENLQNGQKNMVGKKLACVHSGAKSKKILYFVQILVWNCFERLFRKIS